MKYIFILLLVIAAAESVAQSAKPASPAGRYAGSKKALIGKTYTDSHQIEGLKGWTFREGSVITPFDSPELITADVFQKGTTYIIMFSIKEDTAGADFTIADMVEVKNISNSYQVKTGLCKEGDVENAEIVAIIKPGNTEFSKAIKAWRFNRDKRRIEVKSIKNISCLNEGFDQT